MMHDTRTSKLLPRTLVTALALAFALFAGCVADVGAPAASSTEQAIECPPDLDLTDLAELGFDLGAQDGAALATAARADADPGALTWRAGPRISLALPGT
jgi:hypothetical protein